MFLQAVYGSLVLILLVKPVTGDGYVRCKEQERRALLEIKQELVDQYGHLSSWASETDCCTNWRGVRCSNRTGHVTMLDLHVTEYFASHYRPLRGNISLSLLKLRHLNYLDLSHNDFEGAPILDFNGMLKHLRYVNFSRSGFGGLLSYQFANLSRLQSLDLSFNFGFRRLSVIRYTPEDIRWLSRLSSIQVLDLSRIDLGRAQDWFEVVNTLPYLRELRLYGCNLSANIPRNLDSPSFSLEAIDLSSNHFTSSVYPWLLGFGTSLQELSLGNNLLDGFIPDFIGNMTSLVDLDLSLNEFKGGVPKSFGTGLCNLQRLDLSNNNLEGDLEILVGSISGCMEKYLEILELSSNKLHGSFPDTSIFTNLREVHLSENQLNGSLPEKFEHPSKLEYLNLINNQLIGSFPDVFMLRFLKELYIGGNQLNGTVSQSIGSLSELEVLDAFGNSLTGTMSEPHFLNLSKLRRLVLSGNSLSLKLSQNWTPPFQLRIIALASCKQESGLFPKWIETQKNCSYLDISDSGISDTVPSWFWDFSSELKNLNLSANRLYGELPDMSMKFSGKFPGLDLSSNNFEGELPLFPPNTTSLNLSRNKFSGNVSTLCGVTNERFSFLDLSNNLLTGRIPDCFNQWGSLAVLNLANNRFSGKMPFSIGSMLGIRALDLHNNSINGSLPSSLSNCNELEFMDLSDNNLSGTLPAWIWQNLSSLSFLSLKSNHFSGIIPQDFCKLTALQILDMAINSISGVIPQCIHNLTAMIEAKNSSTTLQTSYTISYEESANAHTGADYINTAIIRWKGREYLYGTNLGLLRFIDLSSNRLTGEIPSEITSLVALTSLNLSRNGFSENIPATIGDLKQIQSLDLSRNRLCGEIPGSLSDLTFLSHLDLSNNNLTGRIPTSTQIEGFDASAFSGNLGLCGKPLQNKCPGEVMSEERGNPRKEDPDENDDDEFWKWFYAGIGLGFAVGFWGICITPLLKRRWRVSYLRFLDYLIHKFHVLVARIRSSRS